MKSPFFTRSLIERQYEMVKNYFAVTNAEGESIIGTKYVETQIYILK